MKSPKYICIKGYKMKVPVVKTKTVKGFELLKDGQSIMKARYIAEFEKTLGLPYGPLWATTKTGTPWENYLIVPTTVEVEYKEVKWVQHTKPKTPQGNRELKVYNVYRVGNRIAITEYPLHTESGWELFREWLRVLSNFACRPMHDYVRLFHSHFKSDCENWITENKVKILAEAPPEKVHGDNMNPLVWDSLGNSGYKLTCPVCNREGNNDNWVKKHFENCTLKPVESHAGNPWD
jgi:hypothetical protein